MSFREIFSEQELDLIHEAIEHRLRYYKSKSKNYRPESASARGQDTVERYFNLADDYDALLGKFCTEVMT